MLMTPKLFWVVKSNHESIVNSSKWISTLGKRATKWQVKFKASIDLW